jgi:carbon monoxide dehydrogenase subunit G
MIETEQSAIVAAGIDAVWNHVQDIARWASIMPGYRECEIIDENDSRWTLKVGVGGLVRTVRVQVHVDEWQGPGHVRFTYKLAGDPVQGSGTYTATPSGQNQTEITLRVKVEGSGPMAPMWEAMGKPLLPTFARAFAGQLRDEIEKSIAGAEPMPAPPPDRVTGIAALKRWLGKLWHAVTGRGRFNT